MLQHSNESLFEFTHTYIHHRHSDPLESETEDENHEEEHHNHKKEPTKADKKGKHKSPVTLEYSTEMWTDADVEELPERYNEVHYRVMKKAQIQDIVDRIKTAKIIELESKLQKQQEGKESRN